MTNNNNNIYIKLNSVREEFKNTKISKSGENKFANYRYLELGDFIPIIIELNKKHGLFTKIDIVDGLGTLHVINVDNPKETINFSLSVPRVNNVNVNDDGLNIPAPFNKQVQDTGALTTYIRRYLYMLYCEIAVDDEIDSKDNSKSKKVVKKKPFVKPKRV